MQLQSSEHDGITLLTVSGEVDLSNSPDLRGRIEDLVVDQKRGVVVELSGVEHIDSSGIAVLIEGKNWAQKHQRGFVLVRPSKRVRMVIELARLDRFFAIEEERGEAVARARRSEIG